MTEIPRTAGLLLAAGAGRRMGGPKALLRYRGRPLIEHAVRSLHEGGCTRVIAVLGAVPPEVVNEEAELTGTATCTLLHHPGWADGMGSSLRAGLRALAEGVAGPVDAALVSLVDQPGIGAAAIARVRTAATGPGSLAAAAYAGRRGHPVLLGAGHWDGAAGSARGDRGARDYLRLHADRLTLVECGALADPSDLDTPEDLHRLR